MPQDVGIVKDTVLNLFCISYNTQLSFCGWGNENDAVDFGSLAAAEAVAADMNDQAGVDKFIGTHPKPH